jgi:uncharacterized protein YndB with AHSA1/START domain
VIEASGGTDIEAAIDRVFDYVADARNEPAWLPGAEKVEKVTDGEVGLGTRFEGVYARAGKVSLEIVAFERPNRLTFRADARIVKFDDQIELAEVEGRTQLRARMTAEPKGVMRLMSPLMAKTMRSQFEGNWKHLGPALEGRSPGARPRQSV